MQEKLENTVSILPKEKSIVPQDTLTVYLYLMESQDTETSWFP